MNKKPNVIGFGGSAHDWSTCAITKNKDILVIEEERVTRRKYGIGGNLMMSCSRSHVFDNLKLKVSDFDFAVACDLVPLPIAAPFRRNLFRIRHHLAHAYSTFFTSPFQKAAVLVVDNAGSPLFSNTGLNENHRKVETMTFWKGEGKKVELIGEVIGRHELSVRKPADYYRVGSTDHSLGHLYRIVSEELGFMYYSESSEGVAEDGKTMGLSAYGDLRFYNDLKKHVEYLGDGQFQVNLTNGEFREHIRQLLKVDEGNADKVFLQKAHIARAVQCLLEKTLVYCAIFLRKVTGCTFLTMAGGVSLNCVSNTRIAREAGFKDIYIVPAAGDNGISLGSALYGWLQLANMLPIPDLFHKLPFYGPKYSSLEIEFAINFLSDKGGVEIFVSDIYQFIAKKMVEQKVIGWFEGRSEFGPRALGHRSILADPRDPIIKDKINRIIKNREPFRPFAGMFLSEKINEYVDVPNVSALPFMLIVGDVKKNATQYLGAITHVDGTTRVQTIDSNRSQSMRLLIEAFEELSGISALLNTSFNRAGEPLVESPMDAVKCFLELEIDFLVIEGRVFRKS